MLVTAYSIGRLMSGDVHFISDCFKLAWYETHIKRKAVDWDDDDLLQATNLRQLVEHTINITICYILKNSLIARALLRKHLTTSSTQHTLKRTVSTNSEISQQAVCRQHHLKNILKRMFDRVGTGSGGRDYTLNGMLPTEERFSVVHRFLELTCLGSIKYNPDYNDIDVMEALKFHDEKMSPAQLNTLQEVVRRDIYGVFVRGKELSPGDFINRPSTTMLSNFATKTGLHERYCSNLPTYKESFATRSMSKPPLRSIIISTLDLAAFDKRTVELLNLFMIIHWSIMRSRWLD